jgi:phosphoribosyl 1,2-cyclic phosphodiesterase
MNGPTTTATFWGTRGSIAVPGPDTVEFGGNTTCIEVSVARGDRRSRFIVDAGTGLRGLGNAGGWRPDDEIHVLLTHLHHDHVLGLPFFKPFYMPGVTIHLWCGNLDGECAQASLDRMFAPPLFPFSLKQTPATVHFHGFRAGETLVIGAETVTTCPLKHPSGATGYRFGDAGASIAVVTDIEHDASGVDPAVAAFCAGAGVVIYDTMLQEAEYGRCKGWGHSTCTEAARLMLAAGARKLVGFHHGPDQSDEIMRARELELQAIWPDSVMAREGQSLSAC